MTMVTVWSQTCYLAVVKNNPKYTSKCPAKL